MSDARPHSSNPSSSPARLTPAVRRRNVRTALLLLSCVLISLLAFLNNFGAFA